NGGGVFLSRLRLTDSIIANASSADDEMPDTVGVRDVARAVVPSVSRVNMVVSLEYQVNAVVVEFLPDVVAAQIGSGERALVVGMSAGWRDDRPVPVGQRAELRVRCQVAGEPTKLRRVVAEVVGRTVALAVKDDEVPVPDGVGVPAFAASPRGTRVIACS